MLPVNPGATFEATTEAGVFATGLIGTVGVRLTDNQGATTTARTTSGIIESPTGSSIYAATLVAPSTAGQYTIAWDDGSTYANEDLLVTSDATAAIPSSNLYVTRAELKTALSLTGQTYADDDIDMACSAASRAIDAVTGRFFYQDTTTRYYTAGFYDDRLEIDDLVTLSSISVDLGVDGTFATTWTSGTDFDLEPFNAPAIGFPYERIHLRWWRRQRFPYSTRNVRVVGTFGWAETPSEVRQYAKVLAAKLLQRARQSPYGLFTISAELGTAARVARVDPDFEHLLGRLVKTRPFF